MPKFAISVSVWCFQISPAKLSCPPTLFGPNIRVLDDLAESLGFILDKGDELRRRLAGDDRDPGIAEALDDLRVLHHVDADPIELADHGLRRVPGHKEALPRAHDHVEALLAHR